MQFLNFKVLQLTLCLIAGILIAHYFRLNFENLLPINALAIIILGFLFWYYRKSSQRKVLFQIVAVFAMMIIGISSYSITDDRNEKHHYTKFQSDNNEKNIQFKITKRLKPSLFALKYEAEILNINQKQANGKILINIQKDTLEIDAKVGSIFYTKTKLQKISPPKNPHQFDYQSYLANQQIYGQVFLNTNQLLKIGSDSSFFSSIQQLKQGISNRLESSELSEKSTQIVKALVLGERQDFEKTTYNSFIDAGVVHILAISGLHFGLIYLFLSWLLTPLGSLKYGRFFSVGIILFLLWSFALFAGFSASVTRAVTMFSIVALATLLQRQKHILNTLIISAFFILLCYSRFLFDVGFQLSYCAVIGIVLFQPLFFKWLNFKNKILKFLWGVFTVSVAAQIGVFPIGLFYFHQFPGLFFMANLVAIPSLIVILSGSFVLIILLLLKIEISVLYQIFNFIIELLTQYISWIASFKNLVFQNIEINKVQILIIYILIFSMYQILKVKSRTAVFVFLIAVIGFQTSLFYQDYRNQTNEFMVFHKSKASIIGIKQQNTLYLNQNLDSLEIENNMILKNYKRATGIDELNLKNKQHLYSFTEQNILIIDSVGIYNIKGLKPEILILTHSPKINLDRVLLELQPKQVVADGSNYKSYVERWKNTCENKNIPFHNTHEKGYFRISE